MHIKILTAFLLRRHFSIESRSLMARLLSDIYTKSFPKKEEIFNF